MDIERRPKTIRPVGDGDFRLAERAARGDVAAFEKLVQKHSALVDRVALRTLGREEAKDAGQEVWVRVWRNMERFRGESAFGTWIYRISLNTCLSLRRRASRREEREVRGGTQYLCEPAGPDADPETNPEAAALGAERREELRLALQGVREEHRAALVLRHVRGLTYAEIAEALDVPDGTAKGWVSRGRSAMLLALNREHAAGTSGEGRGRPEAPGRENDGKG